MGFIKSVTPIIDFRKMEDSKPISELQLEVQTQHQKKIKKGTKIMLDCDFCQGSISGDIHVLKFARYDRFFCCTSCKSEYKKKY